MFALVLQGGVEKNVTHQSVFRNVRTVESALDQVRVIVLHSGKESSVKHLCAIRSACLEASACHLMCVPAVLVILESSVGRKFRYKDVVVEERKHIN